MAFNYLCITAFTVTATMDDGSESEMQFEANEAVSILAIPTHLDAIERLLKKRVVSFKVEGVTTRTSFTPHD